MFLKTTPAITFAVQTIEVVYVYCRQFIYQIKWQNTLMSYSLNIVYIWFANQNKMILIIYTQQKIESIHLCNRIFLTNALQNWYGNVLFIC